MPQEQIDPELLKILLAVVPPPSTIYTLANHKPNWIVDVAAEGIAVETERSKDEGTGPHLVPAWMINDAWRRLQSAGTLSNAELVATGDMNIKRSSFVCALISHVPGVTVESVRPIRLRVSGRDR